jgi:hypothetical protein
MKFLTFIFLLLISFFVYSDIQTEIGKKFESDKEIIQLFKVSHEEVIYWLGN